MNGRGNICPGLFSPGFKIVSPQSHLFSLSLRDCGVIVYRPKKFKGGGLLQHQSSAKYHQAEGLGPELRLLHGRICDSFYLFLWFMMVMLFGKLYIPRWGRGGWARKFSTPPLLSVV